MADVQVSSNGVAEILEITPSAAIPGGEIKIRGRNLSPQGERAQVRIGEMDAAIVAGSPSFVIAKVPEGASVGELVVGESRPFACDIGIMVADSLHPVANPAVDRDGNIFATFSGTRGQKAPVAVYKTDINYQTKPFLTEIVNATGLAFDRDGTLYISSRHEGIVYSATPGGQLSVYVEGMGVATGMAFDPDENLYVGDRSGTIFKISRERQIYVFATIEPSIAAYHLAFGPDGHLYVTGPTTSSFDAVFRIDPTGAPSVFYRGLGRPQGLAFDATGHVYVAASLAGRRGVVRLSPDGKQADLFLSGPNIVGLAFLPSRAMLVATSNALYRVDVDVTGKPLP